MGCGGDVGEAEMVSAEPVPALRQKADIGEMGGDVRMPRTDRRA